MRPPRPITELRPDVPPPLLVVLEQLSPAAREVTPGSQVQSDEDLERFLRAKVGTSYHPSGACRMGSDTQAVVDGEGRVRAVRGIRIADASIMPRVVTANLNAAVMMVAEKLSDRILGKPMLAPSDAPYYRAGGRMQVAEGSRIPR